MRVLNIGGGPKTTAIPAHFDDWERIWLDIDDRLAPDICLDARDLDTLEPHQFDCVYGSHVLEHFYPHELNRVLDGVYRVLTMDGFAEFHVPDCKAAIEVAARNQGNLGTPVYNSPAGVVTVRDMLWGYALFVAEFGEAQAHKTGFTSSSLYAELRKAGFGPVWVGADNFELVSYAFKREPTAEQKRMLGVV